MITYESDFRDAVLNAHLPIPSGLQDYRAQATPKRFSVYRNNVVVSLVEALCRGFPALVKLVGDEFFKAVAREFVVHHPPDTPLMMFYGDRLPEFLESFGPTRELHFMPDVARIEIAWRRAFHAADILPVKPEDFGALEPDDLEQATLRFHPALWFMASEHPVYDLWRVGRGLISQEAMTARIPQPVIMARPQLDVLVEEISTGALAALQALAANIAVGLALKRAFHAEENFDAANFFHQVLRLGIVTHVKTEQ